MIADNLGPIIDRHGIHIEVIAKSNRVHRSAIDLPTRSFFLNVKMPILGNT